VYIVVYSTIRQSLFKGEKHTIFKLLEQIGASEWFDQQVSIVQQPVLTKKHQPVHTITASGKVLDNVSKIFNAEPENV
jgi:hypothetical protein